MGPRGSSSGEEFCQSTHQASPLLGLRLHPSTGDGGLHMPYDAPQHGGRRGTHALRCTPARGTEGYTRPTMHPSTGDGGVHTPYNAHQHGGRRRTHALQCTQHRARRGTLSLGDHWTVLSGGRIPEGNDAGETCRGHTYRRCWRFRNPSPVPDVRTSPLHG